MRLSDKFRQESMGFRSRQYPPCSATPTNEQDRCGMSNATHSRVVGGNNAQIGAYPWLGAIGYRVTGGIKYLCGGTLITQKHVL